jgi:hypothetical protein
MMPSFEKETPAWTDVHPKSSFSTRLAGAVSRSIWRSGHVPMEFSWMVVVACAAVFGCGKENGAEVAGHVTLNGQPLASGTVAFRSMSGSTGAYVSADIVEGFYQTASQLPAGKFHVDIRSMRKTGRKVMSPFKVEIDEVVDLVPARYASGASEISAELVPGPNVFDIDLKP